MNFIGRYSNIMSLLCLVILIDPLNFAWGFELSDKAENNQYSNNTTFVVNVIAARMVRVPSEKIWGKFKTIVGLGGGESFFDMQVDTGVGFVLSDDGYVFTDDSLVNNADRVYVQIANNEPQRLSKFFGRNPELGLALLKVPVSEKTYPLFFGNSEALKIGDAVTRLGNCFGKGKFMSHGVLSAKKAIGSDWPANILISDIHIVDNCGGGVLSDISGKIIGMQFDKDKYNEFIPSEIIKDQFYKLKKGVGFFNKDTGIKVEPIKQDVAQYLNSPLGLMIVEVVPDSVAARAGIKAYDVLLEYDGKKPRSQTELQKLHDNIKDKTEVRVMVLRESEFKRYSLDLSLNETKGLSLRKAVNFGENNVKNAGVSLQESTPRLLESFGFKRTDTGLIVVDVKQKSPAYVAGVFFGDLIVDINKKALTSIRDFILTIQNGEQHLLRIKRVDFSGNEKIKILLLKL